MYNFTTHSKKAKKQVYKVLNSKNNVKEKLQRLKNNPRRELNAHKLKGKLEGKWSCWLGGDLRLIY